MCFCVRKWKMYWMLIISPYKTELYTFPLPWYPWKEPFEFWIFRVSTSQLKFYFIKIQIYMNPPSKPLFLNTLCSLWWNTKQSNQTGRLVKFAYCISFTFVKKQFLLSLFIDVKGGNLKFCSFFSPWLSERCRPPF